MLSQVSDKTKPFAQLKQPVNRKPLQKEELRNKRANAATSTITKQTRNRGRREGINRPPPPRPTASESPWSSHGLVNSSSRSTRGASAGGVSAQQYPPRLCVRELISRAECVCTAHTHSAASLTNNRKQLFSLTRFKQPRITQEGAARLWFHYSPG